MSTRCNVVIKTQQDDDPVYVYHHCDGYPDGVGEEIKFIIENRYIEPFVNRSNIAKLLCEYESEYGPYEMTTCIHGDIEYLYVLTVMDNFEIKYQCIEIPILDDYDYKTLENCTLIEECILVPDDKPEDITEDKQELVTEYPTKEQAIDYTIEQFTRTRNKYSKDDLVDVINCFYEFMNTPLNK